MHAFAPGLPAGQRAFDAQAVRQLADQRRRLPDGGAGAAAGQQEQVPGGRGGAVEQRELVAAADPVVVRAGDRRAVVEHHGDVADVLEVGVLDVEVLPLAGHRLERPWRARDDRPDDDELGVVVHHHGGPALALEPAVEQRRLPAGRGGEGVQAHLAAAHPYPVDQVGVVVDARAAVAGVDVEVLQQAELRAAEPHGDGVRVARFDGDVQVHQRGAERVVVRVRDGAADRAPAEGEHVARRARGVAGGVRPEDEAGPPPAVADHAYGVVHVHRGRQPVRALGDEHHAAAVAGREVAGAAEYVAEPVRDPAPRRLVHGRLQRRRGVPRTVGRGLEARPAEHHGVRVGRERGEDRGERGRVQVINGAGGADGPGWRGRVQPTGRCGGCREQR